MYRAKCARKIFLTFRHAASFGLRPSCLVPAATVAFLTNWCLALFSVRVTLCSCDFWRTCRVRSSPFREENRQVLFSRLKSDFGSLPIVA